MLSVLEILKWDLRYDIFMNSYLLYYKSVLRKGSDSSVFPNYISSIQTI